MASAFSNPSLSFFPPSHSLRTPQKPTGKPMPRFLSVFAPLRPFRASFQVADSNPKAINGEGVGQQDANTEDKIEDLLTMKSLIHAYKVAVLNGDERCIYNLEEAIYNIENEKNQLCNKVPEITTEIAVSREKFLRLNADLNNFRKCYEKEHNAFTSDVQKELIESLLPMVDTFEKAKQQIRPETENEKIIDTSYESIYKQFVETMRSLRVAAVPTTEKPFDPSEKDNQWVVFDRKFWTGLFFRRDKELK